MSQVTLRDIQAVGTLLVAEVDRVCREHGITYYLSEGTLLGAMRHGASIPWDDDVDLAMPRADFERFCKVAPDALGPDFALSLPDVYGDKAFFDFVPHVNYLPSHVHADDEEMAFYKGELNHIRLDIFVQDGATEGFSQKWRRAKLMLIYGLSWAHRYQLEWDKYSGAQKVAVRLLSGIGKLFKQSTLNRAYDRTMKSAPAGTDKIFLGNTLLDELDRTYPKEWFAKTIEVDYDGHRFLAPAEYDKILTNLYGNWHGLPPEEDRVPAHFDLDDPNLWIGEPTA